MRRASLSAAALILLGAAAGWADNWPTWRGPNRNGVSNEKNLPVKWSAAPAGSSELGENVAWKLALPGLSGATPIIWGERIFVMVTEGDQVGLWCVSKKDGTVMWKQVIAGGNYKINKHNMASPSPVTDGKMLYVLTGTGILKAMDFDGKEKWTRDIQKDYGTFGLNWGYASSPLLFEDALYVQVLHGMKTDDPSYLLRIDKRTGKTVWRVERPTAAIRESPDAYTTPALVKVGKGYELVITGGDCVTGHDLETGKELWRLNGLNPQNHPFYRIVASPLVEGEMVFAASRVNPLIALRAGGRGDVTETHRVWQTRNGTDVPSPVTDGKYLYVVQDKGIVHCFDAQTGAEIYTGQRIRPGTYSASPVLADGKIYATSEDGATTVFTAGPKFEILAENHLDDYTLSSPAISDGQIFLRTKGWLWAIGKKK